MSSFIKIIKNYGCLLLLMIFNICQGQNIHVNKVDPNKPQNEKIINETKATGIVGMAFQSLFNISDIGTYSSTCTRENYKLPDEYYVVNFQKEGNAYFIGQLYPNAKMKYLIKLYPGENTKQTAINEEQAGKLAETFMVDKLNVQANQYKITSIYKEKVSKGVTPYFVVTAERQVPPPGDRKVIQRMIIKLHPKSKEIMSLEFFY